jgi:hypothetical protein
MKNWELRQELDALLSEYYLGNNKLYTFDRMDDGGHPYYPIRNSADIIGHAIKYILELEAKIDELSYAQKIIDEVKRQDG